MKRRTLIVSWAAPWVGPALVRTVLHCAVLGAVVSPTPTWAQNPTPEELAVIDARLAAVEPSRRKIEISEGDTRFFEARFMVPARRLSQSADAYEGIVTGVVAPNGFVVHRRADQITFAPRGARVEVRFVYAIHVDPGRKRGGRVRLKLSIVERTGLANTVASKKVSHRVKVTRARPTARDLAADFYGYRLYRQRAEALRNRLGTGGRALAIADQARLPSLARARPKVARAVLGFDRARRRIWVAHRHLVVARQHPDPQIASTAELYLRSLNEPQAALQGLPPVALVEGSSSRFDAAPPPPPPPPPAPTAAASAGQSAPLEPVDTYDPNAPPPLSPPPPAISPTPPVAAATDSERIRSAASPDTPSDPSTEVLSGDILAERSLRKLTPIPSFSRGLVLDDPNIAHGAAARLVWAEATVRESATASALFFHAQAAFTPFLGVEFTVPTELVNIEEPEGQDRIQSVFATGNPLLAVKYRFHLPVIEGRRPAVTVRARWAIPASPLHLIPPTTLGAEEFTREVHFADTYAFLLEKTGLGLGVNAAYQWGMFHFGAQVGTDYFIAVGDIDTTNKATINYGFSFGVLPLGDLVGAFLEARAVSLLPARTEFFTYGGVRGRVFEYLEPALWIALPLGSVRNANRFQIGAELRFSYDIYDVVEARSTQRRDDPLLE